MAEQFDPFARPEFLCFTARSRALSKLGDVYDGTNYEGRPDWWTGRRRGDRGHVAPLRERKPCVIYRLPHAATKQVVRFLYGDGRFPKISVKRPDDTDDSGVNLSDDNAELLEKWFQCLVEEAHVKPVERARAASGVSLGTAVTIVGLKGGRFTFEHPKPQHCYAQFADDDPSAEVLRLVWCYPFEKEVADDDGKPKSATYMFRREYDGANVYVYEDAEVPYGCRFEDVEWKPPTVEPHGLSFCPVLWTRNEADETSGIDGRSLFDDSEEELEALDLTLSRRHQGLIHLGVPQPYETGVADDDGPEADGVRAGAGPRGYGSGPDGDVAPAARKIGGDTVWSYNGEAVNVGLLETTGKAFEVATLHVNDIRSRLLESWGVVLTSMSDTVSKVTVGAEMSAKFLALAHAPLIGLCQEYRHNWWAYSLEPLLQMCLHICVEKYSAGEFLLIPNSDKVAKLGVQMQNVDVGGGQLAWHPPQLEPKWGSFFEPSSNEIKQNTEAASKAKSEGLISPKTATSHVAHAYGVEDIDEEMDEIQEAADEAMAAEEEREKRAMDELDKRARANGGVGISKPSGGGAAGNQGSSGSGSGASAGTATTPRTSTS